MSGALPFLGPGVGGEGIPLVADLRAVELSGHPLLQSLRGETSRVAHDALRYATRLAEALPAELAERPSADLPSLWECFQHEFARHSLAPALMNLEIARAALRERPGAVGLTERPGGAWWLGGAGAKEAVREAVREAKGNAEALRESSRERWRERLLPGLARWAPRYVDRSNHARGSAQEGLPAAPCDVLFLGVAATTAPIIAHLSSALEAEGRQCATVDLHYEGSTAALRRTGVRIIDGDPCRHGGGQAGRDLRRRFGTLRAQTLAGIRAQVKMGAIPPWLGPVVARRLTVALARDLPAMAESRVAAGQILDATRPRLVVGFHLSPDFLAPLLLAAQLRGGGTVCMQHGIRGPVHRNGMALPWDLLLAWGQYTVDLYEGMTEERSRWVVTGNCLYDGKSEVECRRSKAGIGGEGAADRTVLAATQTDEAQVRRSQPRWWLRGVAEACQALSATLLIKPHPAETSLRAYEELSRAFPATVRLWRNEGPLAAALAEAGVLVTRDSTVIYEAALAGKPALTIALPPYRPRFPLAEHGGALGVSAYEEIAPALQDALSGGPRTQELARRRPAFLAYHLGPQDGRATERTLATLRQTLAAAD